MSHDQTRRQESFERRPRATPETASNTETAEPLAEAMRHHQAGELRQAAAIYRNILEAEPTNPVALHLLGVIALQRRRHGAAADLIRKAVAAKPDFAEAHTNLGSALMGDGKLEEAVASYQRAAALGPELAEAHSNLGHALQALGRRDEAAEAFRRAIEIEPGSAKGHVDLAAVLLERGDAPAALAACDSYLETDPGNARVLAFKAVVLDELGQRDAVRFLVDFDRLIRPTLFESAPGFDSLADFNAALKRHVYAHPTLEYEPHRKATRSGKQTGELLAEPKGPIAVLEAMIRAAVEDYVRSLPVDSAHPFLANPPARWRLQSWAVVLESLGHQVTHIHPTAWLSGVYYVNLPPIVGAPGQQQDGWIEFGRPRSDIPCTVDPEVRAVRPEEGLMLLFPSYFFHRTVPFESAEERISIAFDALAE